MRQNDVASIGMNPTHKGLARLIRIAPDPLYPLPRSGLGQRYNAVNSRILCLGISQSYENERCCNQYDLE